MSSSCWCVFMLCMLSCTYAFASMQCCNIYVVHKYKSRQFKKLKKIENSLCLCASVYFTFLFLPLSLVFSFYKYFLLPNRHDYK